MADNQPVVSLPVNVLGFHKPGSPSHWRTFLRDRLKNGGENGLESRLLQFVHDKIVFDNRLNWILVEDEPLSYSLDRLDGPMSPILLMLCMQLASPWNHTKFEGVFKSAPPLYLDFTKQVDNVLSALVRELPLVFWLMYKYNPLKQQKDWTVVLQENLGELDLSTAVLSKLAFPLASGWTVPAKKEWDSSGVKTEQEFAAHLWKKILMSKGFVVHRAFEKAVGRQQMPFWLHRATAESGLSQRIPSEEKKYKAMTSMQFVIEELPLGKKDDEEEEEEEVEDFIDQILTFGRPLPEWKRGIRRPDPSAKLFVYLDPEDAPSVLPKLLIPGIHLEWNLLNQHEGEREQEAKKPE